MVQWKDWGFTMSTSTQATASPVANPITMASAVTSSPSMASSPRICPRVTPRWRSMPNSRVRTMACAEKVAAMPTSPITMAAISSK